MYKCSIIHSVIHLFYRIACKRKNYHNILKNIKKKKILTIHEVASFSSHPLCHFAHTNTHTHLWLISHTHAHSLTHAHTKPASCHAAPSRPVDFLLPHSASDQTPFVATETHLTGCSFKMYTCSQP